MQTKLSYSGKDTKHIFYIQKPASGFKAEKDKVTLLFCPNESGDCLIKPLVIYRSLNHHASKNQNQDKLLVF